MPELVGAPARYAKIRWKRYVCDLMDSESRATHEEVAAAVGVDDARLRQWRNGKKGAEAETVFDFGEVLRDKFGWNTSGIEALYAYGYFTNFLRLLKHLSADRASYGDRLAVLALCVLPSIFFNFEKRVLDDTIKHLEETNKDLADGVKARHRRDITRLYQQIAIEPPPTPRGVEPNFETLEHLIETLRSSKAREVIARAWINQLNPDRLHVTARKGDRGASDWFSWVGKLKFGHYVDEISPGYSGEEDEAIIDSVILLSEQLTKLAVVPTFVAMRLWRILAEWAVGVNDVFWVRRVFLPYAFVSADARLDRDIYDLERDSSEAE